ncbi:alpha/beta hydrolase [Psychroserpens mesophilus]|uniref:alpha/beta hydrolase n=1 Tax=Psychroserpens mesophilus TaxID=325473 RepID=UPI003F498776
MRNLVLIVLVVTSFATAQSKVIESLTMTSKLLNTQIKYSVYLPENYENSNQNFPVVYLLNGLFGNETDWIKQGDLKQITDSLIKRDEIIPMVIIMPDGDDRLYMNKEDETYPYEDMIITEFIPFVEQKYRIKSEKKFRAISGLSMGGAGSLRLALKYDSLFGACAGFSSGISTEEEILSEDQESFDSYFGRISPSAIGSKGNDRLTPAVKAYDVLRLVNSKDPDRLKTVHIYFDCGDDDFLTIGNSQLHIDLTKKAIPHEFRMRDGNHDWEFWRESLPSGLLFISQTMLN